jgi:hypothetical protein
MKNEQRAGNLADLVAAMDGFDLAIEITLRQPLHRRRHLDEWRGKPAAKQQRRDHHRQHGAADRPEHVSLHRGEIVLTISSRSSAALRTAIRLGLRRS